MRVALFLLLVLAGCPRPAAVADAGPAEAQAGAADAGWLTQATLDAWLRYQRALQALPPVARGDAGVPGKEDVRARARAEAVLRADAGLSADGADRIEAVVAAVVTERTLAKLGVLDAVEKFDAALDQLGPEQRAKAEAALTDLKAKAPQAALAPVEAQFGADAVRVVLTREAEVTKTWDALLEARGDRK
ncbi:MAG: hypothetical protein IT380_25845 [Myxococcales bacterium]|nr:hypothetical protein [Myxococcales bacterium]